MGCGSSSSAGPVEESSLTSASPGVVTPSRFLQPLFPPHAAKVVDQFEPTRVAVVFCGRAVSDGAELSL